MREPYIRKLRGPERGGERRKEDEIANYADLAFHWSEEPKA